MSLEFAGWLLLGVMMALVVHESGHLLAALALGGRDVRVRREGARVLVDATLPSRQRSLAFLLAGPLTSALVGAALLALGGKAGLCGAVHVLFAATTLFPHGTSDGARALALVSTGNDADNPAR